MDFIERLCDKINEPPKPSIPCVMGYLGAGESLVVYPLPGSQITQEYMDGTTDQSLNYEIAMKSKLQSNLHRTLWNIQNKLEALNELASNDDSFQLDKINITSKPFINEADEQGWFVFLLEIQAKIMVIK